MDDVFRVEILQSIKQLHHYANSDYLVCSSSDDLLEELSSLAQLQNEYVWWLVVVDLEKSGDVGVVKSNHDCHLFQQLLMVSVRQFGLFDLLGRPQHVGKPVPDFADSAETSSADFFEDCILF